ncbi:MAG TPA: non-canonical purine NTP pyrophosphatase [Abditibacterium sp.]|jgi:XTP/dITP diphosphohydrolase
MKILIATTSAHKKGEIAALLAEIAHLELETLSDYPATEAPDEDGASMAENAQIKANYYAAHFGKTVLADDSGLEVDALNGQPGIHSARWSEGSDADRARAILERLQGVPEAERCARYRCALCLASPQQVLLETEATCEGAIALEAAGDGGFGYDPIFQITLATGAPAEYVGQTLGQVAPAVKAQVSHRARAVRELAQPLAAQSLLHQD